MTYYSQYQQDYWADRLLKEKEKGFFLDIGANDGITISNSYFFEKQRGWNGICVEPIPDVYAKLVANRKCITVNACISDKTGQEVFFRIEGHNEMLSGIKSAYHDEHWKRIVRDTEAAGDKIIEFPVDCLSANEILDKQGVRDIDFLSIDTEGSELKIIQGIDFDRFSFSVICVENPYNDRSFEDFLSARGYLLCKIVDCDYIFINKRNRSLVSTSMPHVIATRIKRGYSRFKVAVKKMIGK